MKKYIIGSFIVFILIISSLFFKKQALKSISTNSSNSFLSIKFPNLIDKEKPSDPKLYLFVFFSKNNCRDCLGIIETLNNLDPKQFIVKGIVPKKEFENIEEIRSLTGAAFHIESDQNYQGVIPIYTPTVMGLSKNSNIFFILPGVPDEKDYLEKFLVSFFNKTINQL